ncbi:MAG: RNA polymerase factor sigma-54 [Porticoccaceae bacterium]
MKQTLQLKLGHQLSMTPQLQQAIKLLQLSSLELHQEIQQTLYANPLIELTDEVEEREASDEIPDIDDTPIADADDWGENIPDDLPVDAKWDDIFQSMPANSTPATGTGAETRDFESFHTVTESLQDHLHWQLNLTPMSDTDRIIAAAVIDLVGEDGFLEAPVEEVWATLTGDYPDIELDEVLAVLHRIQHFDPAGVAATSLRECLLIQLGQFDSKTPHLSTAKLLVDSHLQLVGEHNSPVLSRKCGLSEADIDAAIKLIQTLSPRPGSAIAGSDPDYITPDLRVRKEGSRWVVALNREITPRLCINQEYAKLVQRADDSADNTFLRTNLQEARWFLRSLESRNETLLRVAHSVVEMQREFLEQGPEAMKPMVLADIAEKLQMHESTISRVTTQKYIDTPRGVFELKFFFSSHVSTASGGECSSTAIRAMLKKMIASESAAKPLSDSDLATLLQAKGIQVARRTVAKYRDSLGILRSSERKSYRHST